MSELFIHTLNRIIRKLMREYNERFLTVGLSAQQFLVLFELTSEGHQKASVLADRCGLDRATITSLMNGLEQKRLIKRTINKVDRRSVVVDLTPSGRQLGQKLTKLAKEYHELLGQRLGEQKVQELIEYLKRLPI